MDIFPGVSQVNMPLRMKTTDLKESAGCSVTAASQAWPGARKALREEGRQQGIIPGCHQDRRTKERPNPVLMLRLILA